MMENITAKFDLNLIMSLSESVPLFGRQRAERVPIAGNTRITGRVFLYPLELVITHASSSEDGDFELHRQHSRPILSSEKLLLAQILVRIGMELLGEA